MFISKELAKLLAEDFVIHTNEEHGYTELSMYTPNGEDWMLTVSGRDENQFLDSLDNIISNFDRDEEFYSLMNSDDYGGYGDLMEDQLWKENFLNGLWRKIHYFLNQCDEVKNSKYIPKKFLKVLNSHDIYIKRVNYEDDDEEHLTLSMFTSKTDWYVIYFKLTKSIDFTIALKFALRDCPQFRACELVDDYQEAPSKALEKIALMSERQLYLQKVVRELVTIEDKEA